jgi:O-antigen/teichoic acid export membrane protein
LAAFKEQASREFREAGNCIGAFRQAFRSLSGLAVVPFALVWLVGEPAFAIVFGDEWAQAGRFAEILTLMFAFKFVASPLSYTLYIANRQLHDLVWQIALLAMTVAIFTFDAGLERLMVTYSAGYSILYLAYLAMSYSAARGARP